LFRALRTNKRICCQQVLKSQEQVRVQVQVPSTTALLNGHTYQNK